MSNTRRDFLKKSAKAAAGTYIATAGFSAQSYARIMGANDRVRVGVVGFSDRHRSSHIPPFMKFYKDMNFDIVSVSDLWKRRRDEGQAFLKDKMGHAVNAYRNNEELYNSKTVDAVFISTPDFAHALHTIEAVKAGCDVYCEKPFAETMEDNRAALEGG
jgi:predicted dehydrogenase